eukprot:scaffold27294_cov59-Phaeocystis_antarctica.AAC.1
MVVTHSCNTWGCNAPLVQSSLSCRPLYSYQRYHSPKRKVLSTIFISPPRCSYCMWRRCPAKTSIQGRLDAKQLAGAARLGLSEQGTSVWTERGEGYVRDGVRCVPVLVPFVLPELWEYSFKAARAWISVTCPTSVVCTFGRIVALVRKKGATRQRGLKLRLRDLGKIWVLALAPRSRPLQAAPYASSQGRTRHPQPLQPPSRSRVYLS